MLELKLEIVTYYWKLHPFSERNHCIRQRVFKAGHIGCLTFEPVSALNVCVWGWPGSFTGIRAWRKAFCDSAHICKHSPWLTGPPFKLHDLSFMLPFWKQQLTFWTITPCPLPFTTHAGQPRINTIMDPPQTSHLLPELLGYSDIQNSLEKNTPATHCTLFKHFFEFD